VSLARVLRIVLIAATMVGTEWTSCVRQSPQTGPSVFHQNRMTDMDPCDLLLVTRWHPWLGYEQSSIRCADETMQRTLENYYRVDVSALGSSVAAEQYTFEIAGRSRGFRSLEAEIVHGAE
jgi:hypothetical protein